jgi:hypothetical protein
MARSTEYRRNAEDCIRLAERTGLPGAKSILMMMAGAWHRLAQRLENVEGPANCVGPGHVERSKSSVLRF